MIIRSLRLRHGRIALPRTASQAPRRRYASLEETPSQPQPTFTDSSSAAIPVDQSQNASSQRVVPLNDPNHPVAQDYAFYQHQRERTERLGSAVSQHYKPHELVNYPPSPKDVTLELLMASQSHLGHATSLWHPGNAQYIFGIRGDHDPIHIISPDVTAAHLRRAAKVVSGVTERGGLVLFVGTRDGQQRCVVKAAELAKGCHLFTKWIPGSITNGQQILGRCGKKVIDEHDEEVLGFEDQLPAKAAIKPDLVVCLNPLENYVLLHECGLNNIPTIGIIDTDVNPTWVTYPVPANDDSLRCVQVIAGVLGNAGKEGQMKRLDNAKRGIIEYSPTHSLTAPKKVERKREPTKKKQRIIPVIQPVAPQTDVAQPTLQAAGVAAGAAGAGDGGAESSPPDDLVGINVKQQASDEALLEAADSAIREESEAAGAALSHIDPLPASSQQEPAVHELPAEAYAEQLRFDGNRTTISTSLGEPDLSPRFTKSPTSSYTRPSGPAQARPAPEVSQDELSLSERDEAGQATDYTPSASESSAPRAYPPTPARPTEPVSREVSAAERQLSETDPELDSTWAEHDSPRFPFREDAAAPPQELGDDGPGGQQLDYALEGRAAAAAKAADGQVEGTFDQVGEVEKELGEQAPHESTDAPLGVAAEEPFRSKKRG